ncbi:MAG: universal stress protein [Pseudomonadota bacterium]
MAIRNILVSYNGLAASDSALGVAMLMARKHDAHLTGVVSHGPSRISAALGPWITADLMEQVVASERERREEIAKRFRESTLELEKERPGKVHFLDLAGDADESLMEAARVYDVVVMGRHESSPDVEHLAPHADVVALRSGRPVLIVPKGYRTDRLGERAVLAWDGGRAAARAMSDAMGILEGLHHVTVTTVGESEAAQRHEGRDVVAHLARHGVQTDWLQVKKPKGGVPAALLNAVEDRAAGLLVMGAYEHSKFSEDLIGGTTRAILAEAKVPVLMAH